jgi:hypothetical protein
VQQKLMIILFLMIFYCRVEIFNPLTEEKHNEIMKEELRK